MKRVRLNDNTWAACEEWMCGREWNGKNSRTNGAKHAKNTGHDVKVWYEDIYKSEAKD